MIYDGRDRRCSVDPDIVCLREIALGPIGGLAQRERVHHLAVCIDPRRLRALTKTMPVKTDRNDARAIAQVIRVGWCQPVHIKSPVSQELRMLLSGLRCW